MKYYHYLSQSKIEMLFPQVPHAMRETVSAEVGFNFGVLSGKVGSEARRFDESVARLIAVERYLDSVNEIGTVSTPREWFSGEMMAKTLGLWTGGGAVFFAGKIRRTMVVLGGSEAHLLGGHLTSNQGPPWSITSRLMHALEDLVANQRADAMSRIVSLEERHQDDYDAQLSWRTLAAWMVNRSKGVEERIHFVARTLLTGTLDDQRIILATPLYVAAGSAPRTK